MDAELSAHLTRARETAGAGPGSRLTMCLPGMFTAYGRRGRYPAVSLTAGRCEQNCAHCGGKLAASMLPAETPEALVALGRRLWQEGQEGLLLSGGSDPTGRLPWPRFLPAIAELRETTGLRLSAHVGRVDAAQAGELKQAGVDQALVDVVGDPATSREILHLADGLAAQTETLAAVAEAGLTLVPHVILGLHGGAWRGEEKALDILAGLHPARVVFVVFMPLKGTDLAGASPVRPREVARFLCLAREALPRARHHLGCARPRGAYRRELDALAVAAGIDVLALPSDAALARAAELGRVVEHLDSCCSRAA
ncbi:MAG: radical SAM protein [Deltaproteobacteria bacterium]|nr:radical SAM protein [Deltaproteobacteria bacterium]